MQPVKSNAPTVSVIMNCLNGEAYLREAIDSIYAQTYIDWEIIFLDNASQDRSPQIAKSYNDRLRYFKIDTTVPLGEARNIAMKQASGEYIAFLDCDDLWLPTKLEKQIALFARNPNVGIVYSDAVDYYQSDGSRTTHFRNIGLRPRRGRIFPYLLAHYTIPMPTAVLRKRALLQQDSWFERDYQICTDYDLFLRIAHDWECDYVNEPLAIYRMHESTTERLHRNIAKELSQTLDRFGEIYSDFGTRYRNEIRQCRRIISFQEAKSLWRTGEGEKARGILRKHLIVPKFMLAYAASYFSYERINGIVNAFRRTARTKEA